MKRNLLFSLDDDLSPPSLYDGADDVETPSPDVDAMEERVTAGPRAPRADLFDPEVWRAAQGTLSGDLAAACLAFGRLDALLTGAGEGVKLRLALQEVADLGWHTGARIGTERLALFVALRVGAGDEAALLGQFAWGVRRLTGNSPVLDERGGARGALSGFLGFAGDAVLDLAATLEGSDTLHPVTQAALLFHAWKMAGAERETRDIEGGVMAARHVGACLGRGAMFLPLALGSGTALRGQGSVEARLAAFYQGAEQASLSALMLLGRVADWEQKALAALADRSGRTPAQLIAVFARWPMVSAPMAETQTGASRAAVQRNLEMMADRGLVREITGQGRYRVWTAAL